MDLGGSLTSTLCGLRIGAASENVHHVSHACKQKASALDGARSRDHTMWLKTAVGLSYIGQSSREGDSRTWSMF